MLCAMAAMAKAIIRMVARPPIPTSKAEAKVGAERTAAKAMEAAKAIGAKAMAAKEKEKAKEEREKETKAGCTSSI